MKNSCGACHGKSLELIYESPENHSITTMNTLVPGRTQIYFCNVCGHLQTSELPNLAEYYAVEYTINANSDDEDQIYKVVNGRAIYRAEHQAAVLQSKLSFPAGCRVLDYGCAKAPTLRKLLDLHPHIEPYLFDLTDKYQPFWSKFAKPENTAVGIPNPAWDGCLDVVLSFYALEHASDLDLAIRNVRRLLKPGGTFYFIVPNVYRNIADFIVADHVNHFSKTSIQHLLGRNGFVDIEVDDEAHDAAFVVTARYTGRGEADMAIESRASEVKSLHAQVEEMAAYWKTIVGKIRAFEQALPQSAVLAVYGAGFYANFIALSLSDPQRISAFVDQNRHLQGTSLHERPVKAPGELPSDVTHVLVGLNPRIAQTAIQSIEPWRERSLNFLYL